MTVKDTSSQASMDTLVDTAASSSPSSSAKSPKLVVDGDAAIFFQHANKSILAGILDRLDRTDCVFLALTCHGAHDCIAPHLGLDAGSLNRTLTFTERMSFLTTLARDLPDHYVCDQCLKLHTVGKRESHAVDVALVESASYKKRARETALEQPCQRSAPASTTSSPHSRPVHSFTGNLSSARRTPLAGVLHRDVELALKRARLLKAMDDEEAEHARRALAATDLNSDDCNDADAQYTSPIDRPVGSITTTYLSVPTGPAGPASTAGDDSHHVHQLYRKNGWMSAARDAVSHTAGALVPGLWKSHDHGHGQVSGRSRSRSHSQTQTQRQHLESALAAALKPTSADRLLVKSRSSTWSSCSYEDKTTVKYTFAPKLVNDRFLLKTTLKMQRSEVKNIALSVCPHQLLNHRVSGAWYDGAEEAKSARDQRRYRYIVRSRVDPPFLVQNAVCTVDNAMHDRVGDSNQLYELGGADVDEVDENEYESDAGAAEDAKDDKEDMRQRGSCHRCATDFAVRGLRRPNQILLTVWQDLGGEGLASDAHWQSLIAGALLPMENRDGDEGEPQTTNLWDKGLSVEHEPGSVRALYERAANPWV